MFFRKATKPEKIGIKDLLNNRENRISLESFTKSINCAIFSLVLDNILEKPDRWTFGDYKMRDRSNKPTSRFELSRGWRNRFDIEITHIEDATYLGLFIRDSKGNYWSFTENDPELLLEYKKLVKAAGVQANFRKTLKIENILLKIFRKV